MNHKDTPHTEHSSSVSEATSENYAILEQPREYHTPLTAEEMQNSRDRIGRSFSKIILKGTREYSIQF